jgi:NAD(P)-dependent dehydrogenase (short-subunit alcohol dehydrogenase family)
VKGKTVLVTGANTGIGLETAAALADLGARVVITSRDPGKGEAAVETILERVTGAEVDVMALDLALLSSVRSFAADFLARYDALHVLVNNAGLMQDKRSVTQDGYETTFQVNHLGPFLLTNLLLERIKDSAPARIVNVASVAHRGGVLDFEDLQSESSFRGMRVYGTSKLCNILFTRELARRLEGSGVTANSLHPGTVRTGFGRDGDSSGLFALGVKLAGVFFLSPAQGAKTSIHLASSPDVEGKTGEYWVKCRIAKPTPAAQDDEAARRLWDVSEQLVEATS